MNSVLMKLGQWTIRSCGLAAAAQAGLWLTRAQDPRTRLSVWTAVLCAAFLMPAVRVWALLDHLAVSISILSTAPESFKHTLPDSTVVHAVREAVLAHDTAVVFGWAAIASFFLLRMAIGLVLAARVARKSTFVQEGVRQSDLVAVPVTTGWWRPVILLPASWRSWAARKLTAVLAHERSHVRRRDPLVRLAAAFFRSVAWFNPLSWWLYAEVSCLMEHLSDEAGLNAIQDQVLYAEIVVSFFREASSPAWAGAIGIAQRPSRTRRVEYILNADLGGSQTRPIRLLFLLQPALALTALVVSLPLTDAAAPLSSALSTDLSGAWRLNVSQSVFRNPAPPSECLLKIQHNRSTIQLVFDFMKPNGRARHQALRLETLGKSSQRTSGGMAVQQSAVWCGNAMVISEKWATMASERVFSTSQDRNTLRCQTTYRLAGRTIEDSEIYDRLP